MQPDRESFFVASLSVHCFIHAATRAFRSEWGREKRGLLSCFHSSTIGICSGYVQLLFAVHVQHADRSELSYSFTLQQTHWKYVLWIYITFHNDKNFFFSSAAKKSDVVPVRQRKGQNLTLKQLNMTEWVQSQWTHSQNPLKLTNFVKVKIRFKSDFVFTFWQNTEKQQERRKLNLLNNNTFNFTSTLSVRHADFSELSYSTGTAPPSVWWERHHIHGQNETTGKKSFILLKPH